MTDWIKHDGGPQPVADDVWVARRFLGFGPAEKHTWSDRFTYHVLNQHLIDAARLEGIRLGLEAAAEEADYLDEAVGDALRRARRRLLAATIAKEADQ